MIKYGELTLQIASSIYAYHAKHPELSALDVLKALEELRFKLTEDLLQVKQ